MKNKIEQQIKGYLNAWICTTTRDPIFRQSLVDNVVLAGGAITSLLRNENVNDYDIYIQDKNVLKQVMQHYIKDYPNLTIVETPEYDYIEDKNLKNTVLYFKPLEKAKINYLTYPPMSEIGVKVITQNAITLDNGIQIITRFSGDPETIVNNFDFVHTKNYFTFKTGLVLNEKSLLSILSKNLIYISSEYPLTSLIRMCKFLSRGWTIRSADTLKIAIQINSLDLLNIEVLKEQLIGVDILTFNYLIHELETFEKKGTPITDKLIIEAIQKSIEGTLNT